ncbi:hypothetical protein ECANGB1_1226 [Enterospora canceri]|uniref:Uncharacterized protein n=1 Tax=Enterospora canceri TaxID=1081671 RepID=A0A1Y1S6I9_9MICR|nr:hypothetical protein ECANGB1_1226 [Enterospora canceri]
MELLYVSDVLKVQKMDKINKMDPYGVGLIYLYKTRENVVKGIFYNRSKPNKLYFNRTQFSSPKPGCAEIAINQSKYLINHPACDEMVNYFSQ